MSKGVRRVTRFWCTPHQQRFPSHGGAVAPHSKTLARSRGLLLFLALLFCLVGSASAHEVRPAYLQLHEEQSGEFSALWKTPMRGELRLALEPEFSGRVENVIPLTTRQTGNAAVQTWRLRAIEPLRGQAVRIRGLEGTMTDTLVRIEFTDGSAWVKRLTPQEPVATIPAQQSGWSVAGVYLKLGVEHILLGIDHLLFVLSLLFITRGTRLLVKTVTAFTVAHSMTLALATLGFVHVPSAPVEAVIALSIVFVAVETVHAQKGREGITVRQPWLVAFAFGLLHGFGFAGALSEVGLPQGHIPLALLFFNGGVELGQLLFIVTILTSVSIVRLWSAPCQRHFASGAEDDNSGVGVPRSETLPRWVELAPPYAIGSVAIFWVIQRIAAF